MQKHVNLLDLVKSFPTSILVFQILASIQPRTSLLKFIYMFFLVTGVNFHIGTTPPRTNAGANDGRSGSHKVLAFKLPKAESKEAARGGDEEQKADDAEWDWVLSVKNENTQKELEEMAGAVERGRRGLD